MLLLDRSEKCLHLGGRLQMVDPLGRRRIGDELPVSRRQPAMAEPNHLSVLCHTGLFSGQRFGFWIRPVVKRFVTPQ
jgi:hypothetical protein